MKDVRLLPLLVAFGASAAAAADMPLLIPVVALPEAPAVDGNTSEWGSTGWVKVPIKPSVAAADRAKLGLEPDDKNVTGSLTLQLKVGLFQDRVFMALRWPDDAADVEYKGWDWTGAKYVELNKRDDMIAMRFDMGGDFDRSMLSNKNYKVDLWLWSAARTNPAGLAEDWTHLLSVKPIDDAAEYEVKGIGTIYIKKLRDAGNPIFKALRAPKEKGAARAPSFEIMANASGSVADVAAKGVWKAGNWSLEFARKMNTGNADDIVFKPGLKVQGQVAVFNRGADENKSVSEPLLFDFSAVK
jgi:hypothetical protein